VITRLAVEIFLGLAAVCALVPLAWRQVLRARREIAEISAEEQQRALHRVDVVDTRERLAPPARIETRDDKPE